MKMTKPSLRLAVPGIAALALGALALAPQANAASSAPPAKATAKQAGALVGKLGDSSTAGTYYDSKAKKMVVNVLDAKAADQVRAAGATPRVVEHSGAALASVKRSLDGTKLVTGSSWAVNPKTDQVMVTVDKTVTGKRLAKVRSKLAKFGDKVQLRHTAGTFRTKITGGDAIWGSGYRCSLGFNVVYKSDPSKHAFLTAGHCGNVVSSWYEDQGESTHLGDTVDSQFPGNDFALVDYDSSYTSYPSAVGGQSISSAGTPSVGETVNRRGSTTGVQSGSVEALGATVQYQEGTVSGLIQTTVCAEPGDSGGSLYSGSTAYGLTSGGSGDCTSGGETFFQPVPEALDAEGVQIG